jgi:hypothetical protein
MAKEYNIGRQAGACTACSKPLEAGQEFVATVREVDEAFQRQDFCVECAPAAEGDAALLGVWRAHVPAEKTKKKLFVNDQVLMEFFDRLAEADEPARVNFRFVLALVLMRKKVLIYDRLGKRDDGTEVWCMHVRGEGRKCEVIDPHLDEEKIAQVSQQLTQIMEVQA